MIPQCNYIAVRYREHLDHQDKRERQEHWDIPYVRHLLAIYPLIITCIIIIVYRDQLDREEQGETQDLL